MRFIILLLFPILINGQKLSEDEFEQRLNFERGIIQFKTIIRTS